MFGQSTFGQAQSTSGFGAFGQPQQTPTGGGGLFGSSTPAFGASSGFGQATSQGFGALGQQPQNQPGTPLFGGAASQSAGFGGGSGLFGQSTSNTPGFGQSTSGFGNFGGNAPQNQGASGGFGTFSQATQSTGFGAAFGQTSQTTTPFGQGGSFGQTSSGFGQPQNTLGFGGSTTQTTLGGAQQQTQERGFYKQLQPIPQISSWGNQFQHKIETAQEANKQPSHQQFHNIRIEPQYNLSSIQMLRYYDLIMKNTNGQQQLPNHENLAMQELGQSGQSYKFFQQMQSGVAPGIGGGMNFGGNPQGGGLFGSTSQGFGGQSTSLFGNQQQQQNKPFGGTSGFGQSTGLGGQPATGGLFGSTSAAGSSPFGQKTFGQATGGTGSIFGQQPQQTSPFGQQQQQPFGAATTGPFGQQQQQQQPGGLFGQQQTQPVGGGLFGQPQQQPATGGGLFGQQQQQPALGGGGLFGKPAGGGGLFGAPQTTQPTGGGLFGQPAGQQQPSGGLFGQPQQQQPGGGLFGQQQQQPGGGLFGQQQQQTQPGGNLFGGAGASTGLGGGLFGSQSQQQQPTQTPSLFGQTSTGQPGGGLFGGGAAAQQTGGGLFGAKPAGSSLFGGQTQQQPGQTSLFGGAQQQQQPAAGGLFGQAQPSAGSTLFGGAQQTSLFGGGQAQATGQPSLFAKPSTGGGLFGPTSGQQTGSLFGGATQTQQTLGGGSSLFGGAGQQQAYGQQTAQPGGGQYMQGMPGQMINPYLMMSSDPFGLQDTFSKDSPFVNIDAELQKLKENQKIDSTNPYKDLSLTSTTTKTSEDIYGQAPGFEDDREKDNYNDQLLRKYKQFYQPTEKDVISQMTSSSQKPSKMFNAQKGYISTPSTSFKASSTPNQPSLYGPQQSILSQRSLRYTGLDEDLNRQTSVSETQEDILTSQKQEPKLSKDIIQVSVVIPAINDDQEPDQTQIKIHISRDVIDLYNQTEKYLKSTQDFNPSITDLMLLYRNQILKKDLSLKEAGIQQNCSIYVLTQSKIQQQPKSTPAQEEIQQQQAAPKVDDSENQIVPKSLIPKPPKEGYSTSPDYLDIIRMTLREVKRVKDFKIFNENGSVHFLGETDLTQVDLKEVVTISKGSAVVYNDEDPRTVKPEVGQKLNKPAIITLNDMDLKSKKTYQEKVDLYKNGCRSQGSEFISYDMNKKVLVMKVEHFTKYGFDEEDSEVLEQIDMPSQQNQQQQLQQQQQQDQNELDISGTINGSSIPKLSLSSKDQHIPNIQQMNQFPNKLYSDPNHIINPKFQQKMMKPYQKYDVEKLFTTQPKTTTIFDNQNVSIPQYKEPLKIQKKDSAPSSIMNIAFQTSGAQEGQGFQPPNRSIYNTRDAINYTGAQPMQQMQQQLRSPIQSENQSMISKQFRIPAQGDDEMDMMIDYEKMSQQSKGKRRYFEDSQSIGGDSRMSDGDMIDLTKSRKYQLGKDNSRTQQLDARAQRVNNMRERILQKENTIKDYLTIEDESESLTTEETIDIFKNLGITQNVKQLVKPVKMMSYKPVFTPNGNLLRVTTSNQIKEVQIPLNKLVSLKDNKNAYEQVSDILIKHGEFKADRLEPNLGQRFESMQLQQQQIQEQKDLTYLLPQKFDDQFIERMMATMQTHTLEFPQDPVDIFYFLEDLSQHLVDQMKQTKSKYLQKKLKEEFYVICTLNALFGNPCIQLVQLHPEFKGLNNYDKSKKAFGKNAVKHPFVDGNTLQVEKQRRNALTEVLRFMCQQEFKISVNLNSAQDPYQVAQHHMFNGDLKSALNHLNINKKTKFAQILAQAMTSSSSSKFLNHHVAIYPNIYGKFKPSAQKLIQYLQGNININNIGNQHSEWARWLQYYLTIKIEPNVTLNKLFAQYDQEVYKQFEIANGGANHKYPLIYFLIKLYNETPVKREQLLKNYLSEFRNIEPTTVYNVQDHRLQLITVLVLYYVQRHFKSNDANYGLKYQNFVVEDTVLARHALQYAHQLLRQDDWKQALLIIEMIPVKAIKTKKMMMLHILMQKGVHLIHHQNLLTNFQNLQSKLKIPKILLEVSRAVYYEYRREYEFAMEDWISANNIAHSHRLFLNKLVPLYFILQRFRDPQIDNHLSTNLGLFKEVYSKLLQLSQINAHDPKREPLFQFIAYLETAERSENPIDKENAIKSVAQVLGSKQDLQTNNLQRFIWEFLVEADYKLKLNNVRSDLNNQKRQTPAARRQSFNYRNNQSYEPMLELTNIYYQNPVLIKYLDGFTTDNLSKLICHKVIVDSQLAAN